MEFIFNNFVLQSDKCPSVNNPLAFEVLSQDGGEKTGVSYNTAS